MDNENHLPRWDAAEGVVMGCRVEGDFATGIPGTDWLKRMDE